MESLPYISRERCRCCDPSEEHYYYDRDLWVAWFNINGKKPSFLAMRDHIKKATERKPINVP